MRAGVQRHVHWRGTHARDRPCPPSSRGRELGERDLVAEHAPGNIASSSSSTITQMDRTLLFACRWWMGISRRPRTWNGGWEDEEGGGGTATHNIRRLREIHSKMFRAPLANACLITQDLLRVCNERSTHTAIRPIRRTETQMVAEVCDDAAGWDNFVREMDDNVKWSPNEAEVEVWTDDEQSEPPYRSGAVAPTTATQSRAPVAENADDAPERLYARRTEAGTVSYVPVTCARVPPPPSRCVKGEGGGWMGWGHDRSYPNRTVYGRRRGRLVFLRGPQDFKAEYCMYQPDRALHPLQCVPLERKWMQGAYARRRRPHVWSTRRSGADRRTAPGSLRTPGTVRTPSPSSRRSCCASKVT
jgi:hypothetical protein